MAVRRKLVASKAAPHPSVSVLDRLTEIRVLIEHALGNTEATRAELVAHREWTRVELERTRTTCLEDTRRIRDEIERRRVGGKDWVPIIVMILSVITSIVGLFLRH